MTERVVFRRARPDDVAAVVALLVDDELGAGRESATSLEAYRAAFADVDADPRHELVVGEVDGEVVATLQLTILPGLTFQGRPRAQVEGVRVSSSLRGQGVGRALFDHVVERARRHGCRVVQLTTDKRRADARRFYEQLGFVATHEGMKLELDPPGVPAQPVPAAWSVQVVAVLGVDRRVVLVAGGQAGDDDGGGGDGGAGGWGLPGVRLDDADPSPEDAVARACREQLGVEVEVGELVATTVDGSGPGRTLVLAYRCHHAPGAGPWPPTGPGVGTFDHDQLEDLGVPLDHRSFITGGV